MRSFGIALLAIGLVGMGAAFLFPVEGTTLGTASEIGRIANLDLIALRAMLHSTAGTCAVIGAVFFGAAHVRASSTQSLMKQATTEPDYAEIDAIWMGEQRS